MVKSLLNILVFYGFLVFLAWLGTFSFILIFCWGIRHPWSTPHRDEQGELAAVFFVRRSRAGVTHGHVEHVYIWVCLFVQLVFKYVVLYVWVYMQYFFVYIWVHIHIQ